MFAGATLFTSILLSSFLQPGSLLLSLATALVVVTPISVAIAWIALPALLALLGERINAGRDRQERPAPGGSSRVAAAADAALRRPALAAALIAVPLLLLAAPALAFNTGAPGVQRAARARARRASSAEAIDRAVGPGLGGSLRDRRRGPARARSRRRHRLALLPRAQRRIAERPGVRAVIGPAPIQRAVRPLRGLGRRLASDGPGRPRAALRARARPAARRGRGRRGCGRASRAPRAAAACSARARNGPAPAPTCSPPRSNAPPPAGARASEALERLAAGSGRLAAGQRTASSAGLALEVELHALLPSLRQQGPAARPASRPRTRSGGSRATHRCGGWPSRSGCSPGCSPPSATRSGRMRDIAIELHGALERLAAGGTRLEDGTRTPCRQRRRAAGRPRTAQRRRRSPRRRARRTARRRRSARSGASRTASTAPTRSSGARPGRACGSAPRRGLWLAAPRALRRRSPHLFDSGYFVLSALDGAPPVARALAGEAVNVERRQAARLLVVSTDPFNTAGSRATGAVLHTEAERLAREGNLVAGVSGGAAILNDYGSATKSRLPLVIGAIVLITFLMLVAILRAPLLAALAVCLNLASVAAAVGVVSLICKVPAGYPLGGHSYIDTVGAAGIFGVTFGLSIDYAVFLLARMRERREAGADNARRDRVRPREDRRGDHRRGGDHGGRLRLLRRGADRHREPAGRRPDGRDPARRDGGPDRAAAGADAAARRPRLACAHRSGAAAAGF